MKRVAFALAAALLAVLSAGPVRAQVPPPPEQLDPVFELVAPIASPLCGNAVVVIALAPGIVAGQLGQPLPINPSPALGPALVICGSVPAAPIRLTCALDDNLAAAVNTITATAGGLVLPVDIRGVGPAIEQVIVIEDRLPAPASTAGLGELVASAMACRAQEPLENAPVDDAPAPSSTANEPEFIDDPFEFAAPELFDDNDSSVGDRTQARRRTPTLGAQPVVGVDTGFAYPVVFALPLVLLVIGGYLGRALTQPVEPPHR